jgi:hypothetical protein
MEKEELIKELKDLRDANNYRYSQLINSVYELMFEVIVRPETADALNHYWHYITERILKDDLGDIEKRNLKLTKIRLDALLSAFNYFK